MGKIATALVCTSLMSMSASATAQARCPAGTTGCTIDNAAERIQQRVNEGARKVINNSNEKGRVEEVKATVKECIECGVDAVKEGMDRLKSDPPKK